MNNEMWAGILAAEDFWNKVKDFDPVNIQPIICLLIDYAAVKGNMTSVELLDTIRPAIESVNNDLGPAEI